MANLLVVDDDPELRAVLANALRRNEHKVLVAPDGFEALQMMRVLRPDIVLTDIGMPRMDGWELMSACQGDAHLRDVPIVLMSALTGLADLAFARGAAGFLSKPFSWQDADAEIARVLET